ncbi:MAG: flippase-like domain-containing protein [Nitrososphaerota archaeon]|jgi:uncharacterized protein (TIRG00374 family)|nr:flippase-like domain-containing protein [Nitrososphaerota archaeon]
MEPPKPKFTYKTVLFPLLGLAGFFFYIYLFQVDLASIIATVQTVNPLLFGLAAVCGLLEVFFFTISWRALTRPLDIKMTLKKACLYVWYGIYVDILVPAESVSGEVTRAYLLTRDHCGSFGKVFASLFTHRLLGMALNVVVLVLGIVLLSFEGLGSSFVFNFITFIAAGIAAIIVIMMVFVFKKNWLLKTIDWVTRFIDKISRGRWKLGLKTQAAEIANNFHESMVQYRRTAQPLTESLVHLAASWFFSLSVPYLVFQALGHPVSWSVILVTSAIVLAVKSIPVGVPFEVGIPEAVMTTLFFAMGVDAALSATATILTRIITLWFRFFIGFAAQQYLEFKPVIADGRYGKTKNDLQPN